MSLDDIKIRIRSFFDGKGFAEFTKASSSATKTAADSIKKATALAGVIGQMEGPLGKATNGIAQLANGFAMLGPAGAAIAGLKLAIDTIGDHFIKAAEAMVGKAREMGDKIRDKLDRINQARMDDVIKALDEATVKAKETATAFDTLAAAYMRVQSAQDATAKSGATAGMSALSLEKTKAMSGAKDDNERALVGAGYDVRIAQQRAKDTRAEQDAAVASARDDASIKAEQARMAADTEKKALAAKEKATAIYKEDEWAGNEPNIERSKAAKDAADKAYADAVNDRIRKEAEAEAAEQRIIQAENARTAAINESTSNLIEARETESRLIEAQKKAAEAELKRIKEAERAAEAQRMKAEADRKAAERESRANALTSFRDSAASQFNQAFDLWRDPEAAQQAVDADKKRSEDMKAFRKAVNRYGGQGKINEYAQLMREGDEEGMQKRLDAWRKSSKFTPQVEQMVKAAAADQNRNAAEKSLANIEKNTSDLAKKIDDLLSLK